MPHVNEIIYGVCSVVIWAIGARSVKTPDAMEQITVMYRIARVLPKMEEE